MMGSEIEVEFLSVTVRGKERSVPESFNAILSDKSDTAELYNQVNGIGYQNYFLNISYDSPLGHAIIGMLPGKFTYETSESRVTVQVALCV